MQKALLSVFVAAIFAVAFTGCNKNSPKAAAETYLNGLYHYDYEAAKSVATEETKNMIDLAAQFSAMMPDSMREEAQKIKVDIKDVKEEGDRAVVTYSTSDEEAEKKLNLVKQGDKWLVNHSKMDDMMNEEGLDDPQDEVDVDSLATPPADGTMVDTTANQ